MAVRRFQDLFAWQEARVLAVAVYGATREPAFSRDFGLASQIQRAAVSVMANIAEGFDRNRPTEFQRFLEIARGSRGELVSHLYVALDVGYLTEPQFEELLGSADRVGRLIEGLKRAAAAAAPARTGRPANGPPPDLGRGTWDSQ